MPTTTTNPGLALGTETTPGFDPDPLAEPPSDTVSVHDAPVRTVEDVVVVARRVVDRMTPTRAVAHASAIHTTDASVVAAVPGSGQRCTDTASPRSGGRARSSRGAARGRRTGSFGWLGRRRLRVLGS